VVRGTDPVLWIHGYTLDSSIWHELWDCLPNWTHLGVDLPGHGGSLPLPPGTGLTTLALRLARLARREGATRLVGLSFGGMVALQVAIELAGDLHALVLSSPGLGGGPQDRLAQVRHLELLRLYRTRGPGPWLTDLWMTSPPDIFTGAAADPDLWEVLRSVVQRHRWQELADGSMQGLTAHSQTAQDLALISAATLVVVGEHDMPAFKRCAELIRRAVTACRRVYLPDAGHLGLLEAPSIAAPLVDGHLRRRPSEPGPARSLGQLNVSPGGLATQSTSAL
jgi:2-succinyl-6-hydroxy-2,4-cyclohexadiene-1-carboxylate synthase